MMDWKTIKNDFGFTHLYGVVPAILISKPGGNSTDFVLDTLELVHKYSQLIDKTKLTKEMFVGEDAIFEGFKETEFGCYSNGVWEIDIWSWSDGDEVIFSLWEVGVKVTNGARPKTLYELTILTAKNPIKLL